MDLPLTFQASAITGSGRGKDIGVPTINVNLASVPEDLEDGIYACFVSLSGGQKQYMGAMHYGPRPVFQDSRACEVHILDEEIDSLPGDVEIVVIERLRDILDFPSVEELVVQIDDDIARCRAILGSQ